MYVVGFNKKALKIAKGDIRKSGEPVPEALKWKPNVLQSHLSLKWLQTKDEYELAKKIEENRLADRSKRLNTGAKRKKALAPKAEPKKAEPTKATPDGNLHDLTRSELRRIAAQKGLTVGGSKDELIERIAKASE